MKFKTIIGGDRVEEVIVYCKEITPLVQQIEQLVENNAFSFIGYKDGQALRLDLNEIYCFTVENNKIYAVTDNERLMLKYRLYQLEKELPEGFIKINQSTIINSAKISRFDAAFSGTLTVILKNGFCDYVSRRNIKKVKERLGI